jgi:hypothetical protein
MVTSNGEVGSSPALWSTIDFLRLNGYLSKRAVVKLTNVGMAVGMSSKGA